MNNRNIVGWGEQGSWIVPNGSIVSSKVCKGLCMPALDLWVNLFKGACRVWNFISVAKWWHFLRGGPFVYPMEAVRIKLRYWNSSSFSGQQRKTIPEAEVRVSWWLSLNTDSTEALGQSPNLRPSFKTWKLREVKSHYRVPPEAVLELLSVQGYSRISSSALAYVTLCTKAHVWSANAK